jgi:hypothetical protein
VPYRCPTLKKIRAWGERAPDVSECPDVYGRIFTHLDDERRARLGAIRALEGESAALLVRTPYASVLSFPGINVVTAAEFAGEMGPIANTPNDNAITGRAGIYPARYQSDEVDHTGPLVGRTNRAAVRDPADRRERAEATPGGPHGRPCTIQPFGALAPSGKKNRDGCPPRSLALRGAGEGSIPPHHDFGRPAHPADEEVATIGLEAARNQRRTDSPAFPPRGGAGRDRDRTARAGGRGDAAAS